MSSSEAYLDSLLSALNGEQNKESIVERDIIGETKHIEELEVIEEPEEISVVPESDDSNKALGADEIAALFAQANMDIQTGDVIKESEQIEEPEPVIEPEGVEEPEVIEEAEIGEEEEEIPVVSKFDDPNKALGADEIAALFAHANMDNETGDAIEESEPIEEPVIEPKDVEEPEVIEEAEIGEEEEEIPVVSESDDPNKALGADEIAALFAQANMDIETGDVIEESELIEDAERVIEPETISESGIMEELQMVGEEEEIPVVPESDDSNKALSADEIAALFAQADIDMETGDNLSEEHSVEDAEEAEGLSIDDMLAQMGDEESEQEETQAEEQELNIQDSPEEIEIDMNNPEELEMLLGLGERPDWSARKAEAEIAEQSEEEILASMSEENPDLHEINSLLNKLDNNELVGEGIEESILVDFEETDFDAEQDPWLDELLGSTEGNKKGKKKERKKKEKKKFSLFSKKKKEEEDVQQESLEQEVAENISEQDTEAVTEILQNFFEDNSEIPVDLFAATEEDEAEEDIDLIALVEADNIKQPAKSKGNKGFFAKMWDVLTEEVPEEEEKATEDKTEKKERKAKKSRKKPVTDADDNEGILEELDAEGDAGKKGKKEKKAKKAKKEKKAPKPMDETSLMEMVQDSKKLPMKMVIRIFALCCSLMALVLLVNQFVPKLWSLADARNAFYKQDYETTYQEMSGKELSESDKRLYEKAKMILQLNHKLDAYGNYKAMNMPVEALDSLLSGYWLWQQLGDKIAEYDAVAETEEIKVQIVDTLSKEYQISEQDAEEINSLSDYDYTLKLEEITGSLSRQNSTFYSEQEKADEKPLVDEEAQQVTQQPQEPTENVLSEEEIQ